MVEKDIEDILETHPYLIESNLSKETHSVFRQKVINSGKRIDLLLIENISKKIYIIELKIGKLKKEDLEQIKSYYNEIRLNYNEKVFGYLIGKEDEEELLNTESYKWLSIKYLNKEIPTKIWLCDNCRKATDINLSVCKYCHLPRGLSY